MPRTIKFGVWTGVIMVVLVGVFGSGSVSALQGMTTQEVRIRVLAPEMPLTVPGTGQGDESVFDEVAMQSGGAGEAAFINVVFGAVVVGVFVAGFFRYRLLLYRMDLRKNDSLTRCQAVYGLARRKLRGIMKSLLVVVVGGLAGYVMLGSVSAAMADPTVTLTDDVLEYEMYAGGSGSLSFDAMVLSDASSAGFALSVVSDNEDGRIVLEMDGSDLDMANELPPVEIAEPLVIRSSDDSAASGDISSHSLTVNVSADIEPGEYVVEVTYFVNTDDGEYFMFTVDTRMMESLDSSAEHLGGTARSFAIPTSGYVGQDTEHKYNWVIEWGDGLSETASGVSDDESEGIAHEYAVPGEYQITIRSSGRVVTGWLNAFGFHNTVLGANVQSNKNMLKSIDSGLTEAMRSADEAYRFAFMFYGAHNAVGIPEWLFDDVKTSYAEDMASMFSSTFAHFASNSTSVEIPEGLFRAISLASATNVADMFNRTFFDCAANSVNASIPEGLFASIDVSNTPGVNNMFRDTFFGYAARSVSGTIPAGLFASIRLVDGANASDMFGGTFYGYANDSVSGTIPSGLFATIDTTNARSVAGMFSGTFSNYARASTSGTIPAGLFAGINTANLTETAYLFNGTFSAFAQASATTIPAGLFAAIDTSKGVNLSSTFAGTFNGFANNSASATIPSGLFGAVNTANASNLSNMFRDTFSNYAGLSNVATIPDGLFDGVQTAKAANTSGMFSGTFYFYGHVSPVAAIPAGLFGGVNLGAADNVYEMFYRSFDSFAYTATVPTDVNNIWGGANFAGRVTADNVSSFFNSTFSNVRALTGVAQTFIDGKLGGIVPSAAAHTFATTAVSDYAALDVNWK